jgi:NAD(P)-dependent dehydrogenase (short-subunit alcohol dehydrogenase family)
MTDNAPLPVAVVVGVGPGLGAALCRRLAQAGFAVAGVAHSEIGRASCRERVS